MYRWRAPTRYSLNGARSRKFLESLSVPQTLGLLLALLVRLGLVLLLLLLLFLLPFLGDVMANGTAGRRAHNRMMSRYMPGDRAHRRTFDAAFG